jgi:DNA-binding protein HU-beta
MARLHGRWDGQNKKTEREQKLNKAELIEQVAASADLSKVVAAKAVDSVIDAISTSLKQGDSVTLVGFGTFVVAERAARKGRDPRSGETIDLKASRQAKFKPGKALKDALN